MPITIAICDDESMMCDHLLHLIKEQNKDCQVDVYHSGGVLLTVNKEYDIYFLDIQMPGMSGMKLAEQIRARQSAGRECVIIFVTALKEYMEAAFDVRAFHYLVKPIDVRKFNSVFSRALKETLRRKESAGKHIMIKSGNAWHKVLLRDIYYIESRDKKNILCTGSGTLEYYGKLKELELLLGDSFFRSHRSYIVNLEYVTQYSTDTITLSNGTSVFIAQKKYHEFVKAFMMYARDGGILHA